MLCKHEKFNIYYTLNENQQERDSICISYALGYGQLPLFYNES